MHIVKPGLVYFLVVFGAGFALAFVRIPFLIPAFGVRTAELMEIPVMLLIITWASLRIFRRQSSPDRPARLVSGVFAFVLLVAAELLVAFFLGARSPGEYIASRDPVSGSVYLLSLIWFAVAPALWNARSGPDSPFRGVV